MHLYIYVYILCIYFLFPHLPHLLSRKTKGISLVTTHTNSLTYSNLCFFFFVYLFLHLVPAITVFYRSPPLVRLLHSSCSGVIYGICFNNIQLISTKPPMAYPSLFVAFTLLMVQSTSTIISPSPILLTLFYHPTVIM